MVQVPCQYMKLLFDKDAPFPALPEFSELAPAV